MIHFTPMDNIDNNPEPSHGAIVIGGSGALGQAVVRSLHGEGVAVGMTYFQNSDAAERLCDELPGVVRALADGRDLNSLRLSIQDLRDRLPPVTSLVHCVSICLTPGDPVPESNAQKMDDVSGAGWDELMSVNVKSAYFACQQVIPMIRRSGGGNIVLVGSISGTRPLPSPVHYATSKTAL